MAPARADVDEWIDPEWFEPPFFATEHRRLIIARFLPLIFHRCRLVRHRVAAFRKSASGRSRVIRGLAVRQRINSEDKY